MAVMTPRANELSVLMRAADALLNAATDEPSVLSHAVEILGEQFGYSMRYLLLYDAERDELYTGMAAGEGSMDLGVMNYLHVSGAWADRRVRAVADDPQCRRRVERPAVHRGLAVLPVGDVCPAHRPRGPARRPDRAEPEDRRVLAPGRTAPLSLRGTRVARPDARARARRPPQ